MEARDYILHKPIFMRKTNENEGKIAEIRLIYFGPMMMEMSEPGELELLNGVAEIPQPFRKETSDETADAFLMLWATTSTPCGSVLNIALSMPDVFHPQEFKSSLSRGAKSTESGSSVDDVIYTSVPEYTANVSCANCFCCSENDRGFWRAATARASVRALLASTADCLAMAKSFAIELNCCCASILSFLDKITIRQHAAIATTKNIPATNPKAASNRSFWRLISSLGSLRKANTVLAKQIARTNSTAPAIDSNASENVSR